MCVALPFHGLSVRFTGDLRPPTLSLSTPTAVFLPFLALICKSATRAGQLSCSLGSSVHHSLQAS